MKVIKLHTSNHTQRASDDEKESSIDGKTAYKKKKKMKSVNKAITFDW